MSARTFRFLVRVPIAGTNSTTIIESHIQAGHYSDARNLLCAQYGEANIINLVEVS